jgi:hypothetical protein
VYFWDRVSQTICPGLTLTHNLPDFYLLNSWDYRREHQCLTHHWFFHNSFNLRLISLPIDRFTETLNHRVIPTFWQHPNQKESPPWAPKSLSNTLLQSHSTAPRGCALPRCNK